MIIFKIVTIFPQAFPGLLDIGLVGRARRQNIWQLKIIDLKQYSPRGRVDDIVFGGGAGMLIMPEIIASAIDNNHPIDLLIFTTARGKTINQEFIENIASLDNSDRDYNIMIICGRYEGFDQRVITYYSSRLNVIELSHGDYITTGGEYLASALIDASIRLLNSVLNNNESIKYDSFSLENKRLLEHYHYTRPAVWRDLLVPVVLLSGHHKNIEQYRLNESIYLTKTLRPDLISED